MSRQIDISSFKCDCGHYSYFFESTVREMSQISHRRGRREVVLGSSEEPSHGIVFSRGQVVGIQCPKLGRRPMEKTVWGPATPAEAPPRRRLINGEPFTPKQGRCLSFIHQYTTLNRRPPAYADIAAFFNVKPFKVNSMIQVLAEKGLIAKEPGKPRSIRLLIDSAELPELL
jgi:repressor LexA